MTEIDILAFAPHPDDAEIYCAGTLALAKRNGKTIGIIDLTRGELSSRGTLSTRALETEAASKILQLDVRENLDIPDGGIENTAEHRRRIIECIRRNRPRTVLIPYHLDRHPDHVHASILVRESLFYAGLPKISAANGSDELEAHRPLKAFYYMLAHTFEPTFILDVSDTFDIRIAAAKAFTTQFNSTVSLHGPVTFVSRPDFIEFVTARARQLGFAIGATYGEGFIPHAPFSVSIDQLF